MKLIKFDLPLNGAKVHNLEELRDNFTTEILELHTSDVLLKWLKSRNLMAEADRLSAIPVDLDDVDKLMALCEIFGVEADRQVIEVALSKGQTSQGVALREDPEELKYKEKFEKLSELLEGLKSKKLYITQSDYDLFVKNKIQIEREGEVECVVCSEEIYDRIDKDSALSSFDNVAVKRPAMGGMWGLISIGSRCHSIPLKRKGDVIEVGDAIVRIVGLLNRDCVTGEYKSPLKGILVEMAELREGYDHYVEGDPICYIRIDHDTAPTLKVIDCH